MQQSKGKTELAWSWPGGQSGGQAEKLFCYFNLVTNAFAVTKYNGHSDKREDGFV